MKFRLRGFSGAAAGTRVMPRLINQPNTQWRCNDDHHREGWGNPLMPAIDFHTPAPGRYDIWVGTFDGSSNNRARLFVTEVDSNHP